MAIYKITNTTNLAGRRDFKFNSELDIEYVDNMIKKIIKVKPGNTIFLTVQSLPLSIHKLRVKKLITVVEVSKTELAKSINDVKKIEVKKPELIVQTETEDISKKPFKKKGIKKEFE